MSMTKDRLAEIGRRLSFLEFLHGPDTSLKPMRLPPLLYSGGCKGCSRVVGLNLMGSSRSCCVYCCEPGKECGDHDDD